MTAPHLAPGHQVAGKYTIRALLGFTGEVATYDAASAQGEEVVVKLYDPAIGQRADIMGKLERVRVQLDQQPSGGVVPVFDSGYDMGTGAPFTACEKLDLPSLARLVETGPLSAGVVGQVMHGVARVLDAAHSHQLFHHALKPTNIFVGPAPHFSVRITDFGAAVVRTTSPTHEAYAQSAPWWAPEQMQPSAVIAAPADMFAAALVAFYALTGRSYWMSCQTTPPDLPAWQMEVMGQRVPISQRAGEFGCVVNAAIDGVFARAMSVNQPDRPSSATEVANALLSVGSTSFDQQPVAKTLALPETYGAAIAGQAHGQPEAAYPPAPSPAAGGYTAASPAQNPYAAAMPPLGVGGPGALGPQGAQEPAVTPGLPPFPHQVPAKKSGSMKPVIIGVAAALLLSGLGLVFLFSRSSDDEASTTAASASATSTAAVAGSSDGDTTSPTASASASTDTDEPAEPETVALTIECKPACDEVLVDNEKIEDLEKPVLLLPGRHTVEARKKGYVIRKQTIDIELGKPVKKEISLRRIIRRRKPKPKPCGVFLRPCK